MKTMSCLRICETIFCSALLTAAVARAQLITGEIRGTVTDPGAKTMPNVAIRLTNDATGEAREALSNEAGIFVFAGVTPGSYTVSAEYPGFRGFERRGQVLAVGQKLSLPIDMVVGQVSEKVTVSAEGAIVETSTSNLQNAISERQFDRIQSQARDATALLRILPGVAMTTGWADTPSLGGTFGSATPNISGVRHPPESAAR